MRISPLKTGLKQSGIVHGAPVAYSILALFLACAPASSQAINNGASSFGSENSKKPIDIDSDRLEVDDKRQIAIFTGNVKAVQGDQNLQSNELRVIYERAPSADPKGSGATSAAVKPVAPAAPQPQPNEAMGGQQIKSMEAIGNVIAVSTKDGKTATGDRAYYDVKAQKITMTGARVLLTQNGKVVDGKKLVIDLATDVADMDPTCDNPPCRVKMMIPGSSDEKKSGVSGATGAGNATVKKKPDAPSAVKTPDKSSQSSPASGWQAQSR